MDAKLLKQWRLSNKLTQEKLSKLLDIPRTTITRWETGYCAIEQPKILELALKQLELQLNVRNK